MNGYDVIVVVPILLAIAVITVYALIVFYAGIVVSELSCGTCGRAFTTDTAFNEHKKEHRAEVIKLRAFRKVHNHERAA